MGHKAIVITLLILQSKRIILFFHRFTGRISMMKMKQLVTAFASLHCQHAIIDKNNQVWFADPEKGLGKAEPAGNSFIAPNGPAYRDVGDIVCNQGFYGQEEVMMQRQWTSRGAYNFHG